MRHVENRSMSKLSRIFTPIVETTNAPLTQIDVVAFDISETLVHTKPDYSGYAAIEETVRLLDDVKTLVGIEIDEVVIMTDDVNGAAFRLSGAGLERLLVKPAQDRNEFYDRMEKSGKRVLAVDNDFFAAMRADVHVNPTTREFKAYVGSEDYERALKL